MSLLHEAVEQKKFDVRMVERNVNRGIVQDSEVQQHTSSLPDDAELAEYISLDSLVDDAPKGKKQTEGHA